MEAIPPTGEALVAALDKQFPLRNAGPRQTPPEIYYAAGQRSVVEFLLALKENQENE